MTQKNETPGAPRRAARPLSDAMLRGIVGGAGLAHKNDVDPDKAIALTVGADHHEPTSPAASVKVNLAYSNLDFSGRFTMKLSTSGGPGTDSKPATATDFYVTGQKGSAGSIKVTMEETASKQRTELTSKDVADRAKAGDERFQALEKQIEKTAGTVIKDIVKELRGDTTGKTAGKASAGESKQWYKTEHKLTAKDDGPGEASKHEPSNGKGWTTKLEDQTAKLQKEPLKQQATAEHNHSNATKEVERADARLAQVVKDDGRASHGAGEEGLRPRADSAPPKLASVAHGVAHDPAHGVADDAGRPRAASSPEKIPVAKDVHTQDADASKPRSLTASGKLPGGNEPQAQSAHAAENDASKPRAKSVTTFDSVGHTASDDSGRARAGSAAPKLGTDDAAPGPVAKSGAETAPKPKSDAASDKHSADDGPTKPRSQTVDGRLPGPETHQAAVKAAADERAAAGKKLAEAKTEFESARKAVSDAGTKAAAEKALQNADRKALDNWGREKLWGKGQELAKDILSEEAKNLAATNGDIHETKRENVLAGGGAETTTTEHDVTTNVKSVGRLVYDDETVTFSSALGGGASASAAIRLEGGVTKTTTVTLAPGTTISSTDHVYGAIAGSAGAKAGWTDNGVSADVQIKVAAHVEISHTDALKVGNVEVKSTVSATAHGEAGMKAGASLGLDGVSVKASLYAEAAIKANQITAVTVGDVTVKNDLEIYAKAKAEAKAEVEVTFNPFGKDAKVKAKAEVGAEVMFGVGIQDTVGIKGKSGGSAEIGGGVYAGKIGVKADVDLGYKDGKVGIGFNLGAALGVGVSVNVKVESNVKQAYSDAWKDLTNGNVTGAISMIPAVAFVRGFFC